MSEKTDALEALVEAYLGRTTEQDRVKAKYAQYERELAEARNKDNARVAEVLAAAWQAGVKVAESGRAMGTTNIYSARREIYDIARSILLGSKEDEQEVLEALYAKAKGETSKFIERRTDGELIEPDERNYIEDTEEDETRAWVRSWGISEPDAVGAYVVSDPKGLVSAVNQGVIFSAERPYGRFAQDRELHALVTEIHDIPTKEFN